MRASIRSVPHLVRIAAASHVAYRAEMTIWILTSITPLIMLAMWDAVAQEGPVAGFGRSEMARYFVAVLIARQLASSWLIHELNWEIRSGRLSNRLLRPQNVFFTYAVWMLTAWPFRLAVLTPVVAVLVILRPDMVEIPSVEVLGLFFISVFLAWLMNFLVQALFGMMSFWLDKSDGLFGVWFAVWSLLSGYVAPLAVFPESLHTVLKLSPFAGMLAVPAEILGGFLPAEEAWGAMGVQLVWCGLFFVAARGLWRRGIRRYGAYGG